MHAMLDALGSPHTGLPVAHVAGTKGKGSVTAMLQAILQEAGYRVGTYTRYSRKTGNPLWLVITAGLRLVPF